MSATPLFTLKDIHFRPNGKPVLKGIDLEIPDHELVVILGPSGSGKSSLLRVLNGLNLIHAGQLHYRGEDALELDPRDLRRQVGMVFQQSAIFAGSLADNLKVAGRWDESIRTLGEMRLREALDQVGLHDKALGDAARDLSGGEQQRLALARTLLNQPQVLLLDEVTAHLDPGRAGEIMNLVVHLHQTLKISIIAVSHDIHLMLPFADHLAILDAGRIRQVGPSHSFEKREIEAFFSPSSSRESGNGQ